MYSSRVAHVHGNALTCSISSMVEGHSRVGLTHMWRGHSHVGLTHMWRGHSRVAQMYGNALRCSISSMVEGSPSRTAHMWLTCTVMPSRVAFPQW